MSNRCNTVGATARRRGLPTDVESLRVLITLVQLLYCSCFTSSRLAAIDLDDAL